MRTAQIPVSSCRRIKLFWEFQYNHPFAQLHGQLYIPNIACNMSSEWLKSLKIISHDQTRWPNTLLVGDELVSLNSEFCKATPGTQGWLKSTFLRLTWAFYCDTNYRSLVSNMWHLRPSLHWRLQEAVVFLLKNLKVILIRRPF